VAPSASIDASIDVSENLFRWGALLAGAEHIALNLHENTDDDSGVGLDCLNIAKLLRLVLDDIVPLYTKIEEALYRAEQPKSKQVAIPA
jgi:hypothetical protein